MIKIEHTEVVGWEHAIRGMRNPMNSWDKSDSAVCRGGENFDDCKGGLYGDCPRGGEFEEDVFCIGEADYELAKKLAKAGTDHRKFMRMIVVYCDVVAPIYWWKEFDTHKVGTVRNSCSTMHKITAKEFEIDDFSYEHLMDFGWSTAAPPPTDNNKKCPCEVMYNIIDILNDTRKKYLDCVYGPYKKEYWWQIIQLLPSSYNQRSTVMLNYEVLANIYKSRKDHKLDEWREFCKWIEGLPYSELITG